MGNSETILAACLEGAKEAGAKPMDIVRLDALNYTGCKGCDSCVTTGRCIIKDDVTKVMRQVRESRVLVLASPIYYDGVTGQMKMFFDRLRPFSKEGGRLYGKRAGAIITTWEDENQREDYMNMMQSLINYFTWFGYFERSEIFGAPGLGPRDAIKSHPEYIEEAHALGKRLVESLEGT